MNKIRRNQKGITLISLGVAIVILLLISSTLIYNARSGYKVKALKNLYIDIEMLQNKVQLYYTTYKEIPKLREYTNVSGIRDKNPNDGNTYYVVDLSALERYQLAIWERF